MELKGKKAAILAANLYEDMELWYPYYRLREAGASVKIVGKGASEPVVNSKHGYPVKIDIKATAAKVADFDAVIVPGGYAPDILRRCPKTVEFVKKMAEKGKVVASICHGPWVLASAGVLSGRKATSFYAIKDDVINAGATWLDKEVVVDRNLITSRTPNDLPAFLREIIAKLR